MYVVLMALFGRRESRRPECNRDCQRDDYRVAAQPLTRRRLPLASSRSSSAITSSIARSRSSSTTTRSPGSKSSAGSPSRRRWCKAGRRWCSCCWPIRRAFGPWRSWQHDAVRRLREPDRRRSVPPIARRPLRPLLAGNLARQQSVADRHWRVRLSSVRSRRRRRQLPLGPRGADRRLLRRVLARDAARPLALRARRRADARSRSSR